MNRFKPTPKRIAHFCVIFIPLTILFMIAFFFQVGTAICRTIEKLSSRLAVNIMHDFERGEINNVRN